ncbi:MAG: DivIVA domain-containing protein, partial [Clostridiaceae bacterium]
KLELMEEKINHYSKIETTIQNTLLLAQNAAEQARQTAQSEADLIIKKANDSAQKIIDKAHNDVVKINEDYDNLKQEFLKFRSKFKNFMKAQIDTFNDLENDFIKNYNVGNTVEVSDTSIKAKEIVEEPSSTIDYSDNDLDLIKSFFVKED